MNIEPKRCAVYTRKSHEDGLEQEYNSLDAQRDAAMNYIASQKANGWMVVPDGSVRAVRLNWDGYVGYAGAILGGWYKTAERVEALLALGELSEIKETPETCIAYHRDMGEEYRAPFTFETVDEYRYRGKGRLAAEYLYLFDDGKWSVYGLHGISEWCDLDVVLETTTPKED